MSLAKIKYRLLLYTPAVNNCKCFRELIRNDFDIMHHSSEKSFRENLIKLKSDAGIVCLKDAGEKEIDEFLRIEPYAGNIPLVCCTSEFNADFATKAAGKGISKFLSSELKTENIITIINDAIKEKHLNNFLEKKFPGCFDKSLYAKKIINKIIEKFPQRLTEENIAKEISLSARWMYQQCKNSFGITYKNLLRIIWVYQAVRLIKKTDFDNSYIAMQLNYKELSSMDRDFRKVLNLSPNEVRKKLSKLTANQLFEI